MMILDEMPLVLDRIVGDAPRAYVRLPEDIPFQLARNCHFRIVPLKDRRTTDSSLPQ